MPVCFSAPRPAPAPRALRTSRGTQRFDRLTGDPTRVAPKKKRRTTARSPTRPSLQMTATGGPPRICSRTRRGSLSGAPVVGAAAARAICNARGRKRGTGESFEYKREGTLRTFRSLRSTAASRAPRSAVGAAPAGGSHAVALIGRRHARTQRFPFWGSVLLARRTSRSHRARAHTAGKAFVRRRSRLLCPAIGAGVACGARVKARRKTIKYGRHVRILTVMKWHGT